MILKKRVSNCRHDFSNVDNSCLSWNAQQPTTHKLNKAILFRQTIVLPRLLSNLALLFTHDDFTRELLISIRREMCFWLQSTNNFCNKKSLQCDWDLVKYHKAGFFSLIPYDPIRARRQFITGNFSSSNICWWSFDFFFFLLFFISYLQAQTSHWICNFSRSTAAIINHFSMKHIPHQFSLLESMETIL